MEDRSAYMRPRQLEPWIAGETHAVRRKSKLVIGVAIMKQHQRKRTSFRQADLLLKNWTGLS